MNILELAALAGQRLRNAGTNGNGGHSSTETAAKGAGAASAPGVDPDLLAVEIADARFRASQSKPEDFIMDGEG